MTRWGMVIDLKRCIGCSACSVSCKAAHGTRPGVNWNQVFDWTEGEFPAAQRKFLPRLCMHCKNAPCVKVCPTGATYKSADGITMQNSDVCIGCRYCQIACPYGARYFNDQKEGYYDVYGDTLPGLSPSEELQYNELATSSGGQTHKLKVIEKCEFCAHHLYKSGLDPATDWDAQPHCFNACPTGARTFGDLNDPNSEVSLQIRGSVGGRRGEQLRPELGTDPSVYYLPR